jgi:hypothetical protein
MNTKFKKVLLATATVAMLGAAGTASAIPAFTFDPKGTSGTNTGAGGNAVRADQLTLTSSELITFAPGLATASATGYIIVTSFLLGNAPPLNLAGFPSLDSYELYFTFNLTDHLVDATGGTLTYAIDTLSFQLHIDQHAQNSAGSAVFHAPSTTPVAGVSDGTVTTGTGDTIIATGSLTNCGPANTAQIISGTAVALNSCETFSANTSYFTQPFPFYSLIFDAFNNTPGSFSQNGLIGAVNNTGGVANFIATVPEPDSIALFGIAAVGMGVAARSRRRKA